MTRSSARRWRWVAGALLACAACAGADPNQLDEAERREGFLLLFDGQTTSGWVEITGEPFPRGSWKIEDGCLKALPNPDGIQDIRTLRTFRAFELRLEWKIAAAGNSGIKYLVHKIDRWDSKTGKGYHARARGLEYQLADDDANDDAKSKATSRAAGLYGIFEPSGEARLKPVGEFNESRIVVADGRVEHWLNGAKAASFALKDLDTARFPTRAVMESPIALQNHNSEVWFRNIRIRPLGRH